MARINLVESGLKCRADAAVEGGRDVERDGMFDRNASDKFLTELVAEVLNLLSSPPTQERNKQSQCGSENHAIVTRLTLPAHLSWTFGNFDDSGSDG